MKRIITLTLLIIFSSLFATAKNRRENKEVLFQQEHIDKVNKILVEKFSRTDCYETNKKYLFINILFVAYYERDFADKEQICKDIPQNVYSIFIGKGRKRYLMNIALICEEDGKIVSFVSEYGRMMCVSQYNESIFDSYQKIAYLSLEKGINKLFNFFPMNGLQYIGVDNNNNKYLINEKTNPNAVTISSLDEMTNEEWKNTFDFFK